jgi:hypothetical protein
MKGVMKGDPSARSIRDGWDEWGRVEGCMDKNPDVDKEQRRQPTRARDGYRKGVEMNESRKGKKERGDNWTDPKMCPREAASHS